MIKQYTTLILIGLISLSSIQAQQETNDKYFEISKNLSIFNELYKNVNIYFVDETSPGEMMKTGIDAMLRSLDPYTNYIPETDIEDYRLMQTGQYGGIGSLIKQDGDYVYISEPYEGFPAFKSGLEAGDKIIKVDGNDVKGKSSSDLSELLKGTADTKINITVEKPFSNEMVTREITREVIKIPSVPFSGMLDDKTGYIKLNSFTNTASADVKQAYNALKDSHNLEQLVFDLRGNGGGLLHESVNIVNFFVPKGTKIVETKGRLSSNNFIYKGKNDPLDLDIPLVVLIDEGSASASEIVSGSLQDLDRAVIIGRESYGKGLVQQTKDLEYNAKLKITIAKYYTPSGRCIQRLDYSDRSKTGRGTEISDSLISKFTTKNGREVMDGKGISPDLEIEEMEYSNIIIALITEDIVFDYATKFKYENASIADAKVFSLSDAQYQSFVDFAVDQDFEYESSSEMKLKNLKETLSKEKYFSELETEYAKMVESVKPDKRKDLNRFKDQIIEIVENEIVSRYHFQKGRTEASFKHDKYIAKAIETLNNKEEYNKILNP